MVTVWEGWWWGNLVGGGQLQQFWWKNNTVQANGNAERTKISSLDSRMGHWYHYQKLDTDEDRKKTKKRVEFFEGQFQERGIVIYITYCKEVNRKPKRVPLPSPQRWGTRWVGQENKQTKNRCGRCVYGVRGRGLPLNFPHLSSGKRSSELRPGRGNTARVTGGGND